MILRYDQGMTTHTDTNVKIIENASLDDVRPGDHLTWKWVQEIDGVTVKSSHEGIAHHQDECGDWWTEGGMWLTSVGAGTLTIRRTVQDLPTASCTVIVPADGRERVEAKANIVWYANEAVLGPDNRWHGVWRADSGLAISSVSPKEITPGTWKVDDK